MIKNNEFISQHNPETKILLISPTHLGEFPIEDQYHFQGGQLKSKQLAQYYSQVATELDIEFLDAENFVKTTVKSIV